MKKIYFAIVTLFISGLSFAQPVANKISPAGKIKLDLGQKIAVESAITIEASLGMGMELNSNSTTVNALEVKNSTATNYTLSNSLTKLKVNMNMMGQPNNYDSENKGSNNSEMAKIFDERMNTPADIIIDNATGAAIQEKKSAKNTAAETIPADDLMKIFGDNSGDAIVTGAFEIIPHGKVVGDSWSETANEKDMKTTRTYTLKSITGNEAVIQTEIVSTAVNKLNFQEMEFEIKTNTKTTGEIITDTISGLVKKRTSSSDISGNFQMMGQEMPITAKANSTCIYK